MKKELHDQEKICSDHIEQEESQRFEDPQLIEPKGRGVFPTMGDLLAMLGIFFISQIAVGIVVALLSVGPEVIVDGAVEQAGYVLAQHKGVQLLMIYICSMAITLAGVIIYRYFRGGRGRVLHFSLKGFDAPVLLGGVLMIVSAGIVMEPLLAFMPTPPAIEGRGWGMLLSVVVVAPILEEILCRGVIFESLHQKRGVFVAWLFSSLFFGVMHFHPTMVLNAFVMGLVLCYIYIRTKSLIAPIILHAFNNAIAYVFIVLGADNFMLSDLIVNKTLYYIVYGLSVVIFVVSAVVVARRIRKIENQEELVDSQSPEVETDEEPQKPENL